MIGRMGKQVQVAVDCADPDSLALFWADALDYRVEPPPAGYPSWAAHSRDQGGPGQAWCAIVDPGGVGPRVLFTGYPKPRP